MILRNAIGLAVGALLFVARGEAVAQQCEGGTASASRSNVARSGGAQGGNGVRGGNGARGGAGFGSVRSRANLVRLAGGAQRLAELRQRTQRNRRPQDRQSQKLRSRRTPGDRQARDSARESSASADERAIAKRRQAARKKRRSTAQSSSRSRPTTALLSTDEKAASRLKMAERLMEKGQEAAAKKWLQRLLDEFPKTDAADAAKELLADAS